MKADTRNRSLGTPNFIKAILKAPAEEPKSGVCTEATAKVKNPNFYQIGAKFTLFSFLFFNILLIDFLHRFRK